MSSYGQVAVPRISSGKQLRKRSRTKATPMKLTFKQKLRNWLMNDDSDQYDNMAISIDDAPSIDSNGFRLQVYKANGGVVVETRSYDRRRDENNNSLYVITEDKDLGEEIGKIITMENLRG
jgi:hypothetical protein